MANWADAGFVAFDTETTGVDVTDARIVTAAAVIFVGGEPVEQHSWLLKVDVPIPAVTTAVHGITDEISQRDGVDQADGLAGIRALLVSRGLPVVCFKSDFDLPILDANLRRIGLGPLPALTDVCAYVIDKQWNKYVRGKNQRRLKPTAERYGIELSEDDWHGAEADAKVAGRILLAELAAYPALADMSAVELAEAIGAWRQEQERDFQEWLSRQPPR
ncbi:MAG: exonuclease domain-containing protein [Candidatus Nanopelagicales bacterium]|nr:exonuclease domain-containing protein [Candidatus Nanopelagicales bacterium]